jgi:hypothetical protein
MRSIWRYRRAAAEDVCEDRGHRETRKEECNMLKEILCHCGAKNGNPPHGDHFECDKCASYWVPYVKYVRKRKVRIWWETPVVAKVMPHLEKRRARFCPWCGEPYGKLPN